MNSNPYVPLDVPEEAVAGPDPACEDQARATAWAWDEQLVLRGGAKPPPRCARTNASVTMDYPDCAIDAQGFRRLIWLSAIPGGVLIVTVMIFVRMMGTWYQIRVSYNTFARMMVLGLPLGAGWFGANMASVTLIVFGEWWLVPLTVALSVVMAWLIRVMERREFNARPGPPGFVVLSNVHPDYLAALLPLPGHLVEEFERFGLAAGADQPEPG